MNEAAPALRPPPVWRIWDNPVFRRYCRSRLRARPLGFSLVIAMVLTAFLHLFLPALSHQTESRRQQTLERLEKRSTDMQRNGRHEEMTILNETISRLRRTTIPSAEYHARTPLFPLLIIQGVILFIIGTGQVAGGMTSEADEGSVDYQRLTPITPLAKTLGYLFGLPVREYVIFLSTLPFTALSLWNGGVPASAWVPVYGIFLLAVILYHLTGLVAGTVVKNRRWAFLLAMGLIFLIYIVVPQGARFGFPFVRYLTLWPVIVEHAAEFAPQSAQAMQVGMGITPGARIPFFRHEFSALAFTLIVQSSFIITMTVMVWRKWRRAESHLLSKPWGLLVFAWINLLLIGNALPMAEDGALFPSRSFDALHEIRQDLRLVRGRSSGFREYERQPPALLEGTGISFVFGLNILLLTVMLIAMMTPNADSQVRGLRRALRRGKHGAPWFADESSAFLPTMVLIAAGTATWYWFHQSIMRSHWFAENMAGAGSPVSLILHMLGVLGLTALCFHAMLESRGPKQPFLAAVFLGAVPLLAAMIVQVSHNQPSHAALWIAGISPLSQIAAILEGALPPKAPPLPAPWHGRLAVINHTWTLLMTAAAGYYLLSLARSWRTRRAEMMENPDTAGIPAPPRLPDTPPAGSQRVDQIPDF